MITAKDIVMRVYEDKDCIAFAVILKAEEKRFAARYEKIEDKTWGLLLTMVNVAEHASPQCYTFRYEVPKHNMPLEVIAAIGLYYLKNSLLEEMQFKNELAFNIGELVSGNIG